MAPILDNLTLAAVFPCHPRRKTYLGLTAGIPVERFDRACPVCAGGWVITVTLLKADAGKAIHKLEWECVRDGRLVDATTLTVKVAPKLSAEQARVVAYLREHGGQLTRWPGGFWTTPDTRLPGGSRIDRVDGYRYELHGAPVWYTSTQTVRAMERKGVLARTHTFTQEWCDTRTLVEGK
jgi:hypothetical protein